MRSRGSSNAPFSIASIGNFGASLGRIEGGGRLLEFGDPETASARLKVVAYGLFVLLKWPLVLGGLVLLVVGFFDNRWWLWAAVAIGAGAVVQVIGSMIAQRRISSLATYAARGIGPVPPREVRTALMHQAIRENDVQVEDHSCRRPGRC